MPCPDISIATAARHAVPRHLHRYSGTACRAPTSPSLQRRGMPCLDISIATAARHAVPRHLHRYSGAACRAPTSPSLLRRGMPCPDISIATAAGHAVPRHLHRYSGGACRAPTSPSLQRRGMPCPDISIATAARHCRNPVPQRSRCDPVMPHPGAPAHRRVSITNGSADGAAAGCMARLDDHPLGCGPWTSARSKPRRGFLSNVEFLGEVSDVLHSRAPLPLIPPAPFSHKGRRGSLGVLMPETVDGTQGLAEKSTPVRQRLPRPQGGLMVFEEIIRHSPRRRALHSIAEGLWSLSNYSAIARAGGLRPG